MVLIISLWCKDNGSKHRHRSLKMLLPTGGQEDRRGDTGGKMMNRSLVEKGERPRGEWFVHYAETRN